MKPTHTCQTFHFMPRHWDDSAIRERFESFIMALSTNSPLYDYQDGNPADAYRVREYFKAFYSTKLEYVYSKLNTLCRVTSFEDQENLTGIVEFKFRVFEDKKTIEPSCITEHTCVLEMCRRSDPTGYHWKISRILWHDSGIDVTDSEIIQLDAPKAGEEICIIHTGSGDIKIRLFPDHAPMAVKNWIALCKDGFYDNTIFSRVIKDFVIQGGALDGSGNESYSCYGGFFKDELNKGLYNFNGALCLGNNGPNTNGNQFYIVQKRDVIAEQLPRISLPVNIERKYLEVGGLPELDGRYTVFGQVFEGMDIVEHVASQATDEKDAPLSDPARILSTEFMTL